MDSPGPNEAQKMNNVRLFENKNTAILFH